MKVDEFLCFSHASISLPRPFQWPWLFLPASKQFQVCPFWPSYLITSWFQKLLEIRFIINTCYMPPTESLDSIIRSTGW